MKCPHCDKDIDESVFPPPLTYCPYCGQNIEESSTQGAAEQVHFCPHCGKELPGKVNFCPYCGEEVVKHTTALHDRTGVGESTQPGVKPMIVPPPEQKKKAGKLYKQWMKYANLPPEAIPSTETPADKIVQRDMPAGRGVNLQRIPFLYILIGLCVFALIMLIIIALVQSC